MNKVKYETPAAEIVEIAAEDILTDSVIVGGNSGGGIITTPEDNF